MRGMATALTLILGLISGLALAEVYYWVDDQGTQYYTTRFESIPEAYRPKAQLLSLPTSPPLPPELQTTPQSTPPPNRVATIPFKPGSPILVSAKINGAGPITLILDTGADRTMVSPSALSRIGVPVENATRVLLKGVTGESYANAVWVNSVEVGEAKIGPLLVITHDIDVKEAEGLLGRDFLANFNVTMDAKGQVVTLVPN